MKPVRAKLPKTAEGPLHAASHIEDRRRSQRVMLRMPVLLHVPGQPLAVQGMTVAVSEVGAMIVIRDPLPAGTRLIVEIPHSQKRIGASVTRSPQITAEGALLPVEFAENAPAFWSVFFPPHGT